MTQGETSQGAIGPAKAIVVLSDGTGNSAGKLFKTNVWRLYRALDLRPVTSDEIAQGRVQQVAYYDDGVGTSVFKPLALLGGAVGWGLKRNVRDLYTFLCRNYQPGDRIYAFGFSRGAFTIRILVGLVVTQGLLRCATEDDLGRYARDAYRAYRRRFKQTGGLVELLRDVRDGAIRVLRRLRSQRLYAELAKEHPETIAFVGVWDTVAAYGLPVTELTRGVDEWLWPLSMPNYELSDRVADARHALALDDERDTFHPLLWDELAEQRLIAEGKVRSDRLQQVWFAGMHSDVGGGYADDSLAHVSLEWMVDAAAAAGLRFRPEAIAEIGAQANDFGPMHDSRKGLASYYRYQPRKIGARLDPPDPTTAIVRDPERQGRGFLTSASIHESVLNRIRTGTDRYAPVVLPRDYSVVARDGRRLPAPETPAAAAYRAENQERVWDIIWKRRINYFASIGTTLFVVFLPLVNKTWPPGACTGPQCFLSEIIIAAGTLLPDMASAWIDSFARRPGLFGLCILLLIGLLFRGWSLRTQMQDAMGRLWARSLGSAGAPAADRAPAGWIYRLRTNAAYMAFFRALKWQVAPTAFGITALAATIVMVVVVAPAMLLAGANRAALAWDEGGVGLCAAADTMRARFSTASPCWLTGTQVEKGVRYRVRLTVTDDWYDATIPATPLGLAQTGLPWQMRYLGTPLRRSLNDPWYQPMVKVVSPDGGSRTEAIEMLALDAAGKVYAGEFLAGRTGDLFLFVNDAVFSWCGTIGRLGVPCDFYKNNRGEAEVEVVRLDRADLRE